MIWGKDALKLAFYLFRQKKKRFYPYKKRGNPKI